MAWTIRAIPAALCAERKPRGSKLPTSTRRASALPRQQANRPVPVDHRVEEGDIRAASYESLCPGDGRVDRTHTGKSPRHSGKSQR